MLSVGVEVDRTAGDVGKGSLAWKTDDVVRGDDDQIGIPRPGGLAHDREQLVEVTRIGRHQQLGGFDERTFGADAASKIEGGVFATLKAPVVGGDVDPADTANHGGVFG